MKPILITRPEPGASETAARVIALGLSPVIAPVLTITKLTLRPPAGVAATLLTSQNAVSACPAQLHGKPAFAVGAATAASAAQAGFRQIHNADGDATMLAELVADTLLPTRGPLLLPSGKRQGRDLAEALRRRGYRVLRRVAYCVDGVSTLPEAAATLLRQGQPAGAMFFSGETSRHFIRLLRAAALTDAVRNIDAVSISERAAMALRSLPWRRISVAAKPNQEAMLALLENE